MDEARDTMIDPAPLDECRVFKHEAMNTTFWLRLLEMDEPSALSVARQCFELVDLLESRLSRFAEGSDVSRINAMQAGETLYLSESCHQCLMVALEASAQTCGLFDITLGKRIEHHKAGASGPPPVLEGKLSVHPDVPAVSCEQPGREIDLGGIGKGYALDQLCAVLEEWQIDGALVSAGASSMLAHGASAWPVDLAGDGESLRLELCRQSLSASGSGIQGSHIVHPWGDDEMPAEPNKRVWVVADSAALAEVWSTALMLVDAAQAAELLDQAVGVQQVHVDRGGRIERWR